MGYTGAMQYFRTSPGLVPLSAATLSAVLLCAGCPDGEVDLTGRPCATDSDCIDGFACLGRICRGADEAPTATNLIESPLCQTIFPESALEDVTNGTAFLVATGLPLSVDTSNGKERENAVLLAAEEIAESGGIDNKSLAFLGCDTAGTVDQAKEVAEYVAEFAGVDAFLGCAGSTNTQAVLEDVMREAGIPMMSPSSSSALLTDLPDDDLLWRTAPSDQLAGAATARFVLLDGFERIEVLHVDNSYGNSYETVFFNELCAEASCVLGQNYSSHRYADDAGDLDENVRASIDDILAAGVPDVLVVVALSTGATTAVKAILSNPAFNNTRLLFSEAARQMAFADAAAEAGATECSRVLGTGPVPRDPDDATRPYGQFVRRYQSRFNQAPGLWTENSYDAAYAIAFGLIANPQEPKLGLAKLSEDEPIIVGPTDFARGGGILSAGGSINLSGASGPIDFDAAGDVRSDVGLWELVDIGGGVCEPADVGLLYNAADDEHFDPRP